MAKGSKRLKAPSGASGMVSSLGRAIFGGAGKKAGSSLGSGLINMHGKRKSNGAKRIKAK